MNKTFSTKQKGDIAEYRVITELLKRGCDVLLPCGDRLPYDIAVDTDGRLIRVQVKTAWFEPEAKAYKVDIRRSQTNRTNFKTSKYTQTDFDYLIAWLPDVDVFYIFPSIIACSYAGAITMVEDKSKRQRLPKSIIYRDNWPILLSKNV